MRNPENLSNFDSKTRRGIRSASVAIGIAGGGMILGGSYALYEASALTPRIEHQQLNLSETEKTAVAAAKTLYQAGGAMGVGGGLAALAVAGLALGVTRERKQK